MAFLGNSMHFFQKNILLGCQECCFYCLCKVCSSLGQKREMRELLRGEKLSRLAAFISLCFCECQSLGIVPVTSNRVSLDNLHEKQRPEISTTRGRLSTS